MKKSLIALAALMAAGVASAQSSVTVFGIVDVGVAHVSNKGTATQAGTSVTGMTTGGGGGLSRIGFRGVEDLGGGLKAGFWLEAGIQPDSGAGGTNTSTDNIAGSTVSNSLQFGRRATVSLLGNFGEARLGRDFTPAYISETGFDPFGNNGIGAAAWYQINAIGQTRLRASNQVSYLLPALGGVYGQLSYAIGEQASNAGTPAGAAKDDGRTIGGRIGYANGPVDVALAVNKLTATFSGGASNDRTQSNIAASYDFGVAKIIGLYDLQKAENQSGVLAPGAATLANGVDTKVKGYLLAVTAPVGPGKIKAAYSQAKVDISNTSTEAKAKKFALGYDYSFSKRTTAYATVARISNSDGSAVGILSTAGVNSLSGPGAATNGKSTGYEIGLKHTF